MRVVVLHYAVYPSLDGHRVLVARLHARNVGQNPPRSRGGGNDRGRVHQVAEDVAGVAVGAPVVRGAELGHWHGLARCVKRELLLVQLGPGVVGQGYPDIDLAGVLAHFP